MLNIPLDIRSAEVAGQKLHLRDITVGDRKRILERCKGEPADRDAAVYDLLRMTVVDADGAPLLTTPEAVDALPTAFASALIDHVFEHVVGFKAKVEDAKKN